MSDRPAAAGRILRNSFWYGIETVLETVVFLTSSVVVARYLGPQKLGYFSYINFFVSVVTRTSGTGLASATRKYMSEFLALDQPGMARAVYRLTYRYQLAAALLLSTLGSGFIYLYGDPSYKLVSYLLIASIVPGIMSWIPAQANNAFEDVANNTWSALAYLLSYAVVIGLTVVLRWDLVGVASASLVARSVEVLLRTGPVHARLRALPFVPLDLGVQTRIRRFCIEAIGVQILMTMVWDRSEMIFLRAYSSLQQIAFYSISFSLANNLLLVPRTFGAATGITLMVEASRDPARVKNLVATSCRYLCLVVFPVHLGAAAITGEAIRLTYGARYVGAIPVLMVAAVLSIPRAFQEIPETLLRTADKQRRLFFWLTLTGIVNIALDALLVPRFGAVGAAWGNGLAQTLGIGAVWQVARRSYPFTFPAATAMRFLLAGLGMAAGAFAIGRLLPDAAGLALAIVCAIPMYIVLVRLMHGLQPDDGVRLDAIGRGLPAPAARIFSGIVGFASRGARRPA